MSPDINAEKLKECVEKSGLLLEHRSCALLHKYINRDVHHQVSGESEVGLVLFRTGDHPTEIDVFCDMRQFLSTVNVITRADAERIELNGSVTVRTVFVAECKGHPSDGFLLVQKLPSSPLYSQPIFYRGSQEAWEDGILDTRKVYMVGGGNFYRCKHKKGNNQAIIAYEMEREGSHNKFFRAYEQIMCNIRAIIDNLDDLPNNPVGRQVLRVVPILITNAPIVAMSVEHSKAIFVRVPWATYDARFQHFGQAKGKKRDFFEVFHAVSLDFLEQFVSILLTPEASLFPQPDLRHSIDGSDISIS